MQLLQRVIVFAFVFGIYQGNLTAQDIVFHRLNTNQGLSQNSVDCIHQDKQGFMWFGTANGLNRYDGYNFKIYRNDPSNKNSIGNNYMNRIYEDKEGILWIGTFGGGMERFDPSTEMFTHIRHDEKISNSIADNYVFYITEFSFTPGMLWVVTETALHKYNKKTGEIKRFPYPDSVAGDKSRKDMYSVVSNEENILWTSTNSVLTRIDTPTEEFTYFQKDPFEGKLELGLTDYIVKEGDNLLLLCSAGLVKLDFKIRKAELLVSTDMKNLQEKTFFFQNLVIDPRGYYWIGTNTGLLLYDIKSKKLDYFIHNQNDDASISHNNITSLYQSKDQVIWAGTREGVNKVTKVKHDFRILTHKPNEKNSLSNKMAGPVLEDSRGLLWIGTMDELNAYDKTNNQFIHLKHISTNPNSLSNGYIYALHEDKKGNLWVGTHGGGLNKINFSGNNLSNPQVERFTTNTYKALGSNTIQFIHEDKDGIFWLGTQYGGLSRFDPTKKEFKTYKQADDGTGPNHFNIISKYEDSFGNLWLGTAAGGLNIFDKATEKFTYLSAKDGIVDNLRSDLIISMQEDKGHHLWIGTMKGLNKLKIPLQKNMFEYFSNHPTLIKDSLFEWYGINHGLPNELICAILEDNNGFLWISTNKGLVKFDPVKKAVIKIYDARDGLANNTFATKSFLKNQKGEMLFGGMDGLTIFHPDSLTNESNTPSVVITDFRLYNESVTTGIKNRHGFLLEKSISQTSNIRLAYHHDMITFEFAAINFINPGKNRYQYKLEGFDKDWVNGGENRYATYTNLDAGKYVFRVRASNNDGEWSKEASIRLTVPSPPWLSWYAYLTYFLVIAFGIFYFMRQREKAARRKYEANAAIEKAKIEERESFRKKSSQDFHDEAGNKITKINLFTELAKTEAANHPGLKNYLEKIYQNTAELSSGMRDFIWALDPARDTVFETILRLKEFGDSMFTDAGVNFTVNGIQSAFNNINLPMDARRAIIQVFKEAMNNCAKHAKADSVVLDIHLNDNVLQIQLSDNGKGFDPQNEQTMKGYGMGIMKERAKNAGAEFCINSQKEKGTQVTFRYNIPQMRD